MIVKRQHLNNAAPAALTQSYEELTLILNVASTRKVLNWIGMQSSLVLSTSFGQYSSVLLKMVTDIAPVTPIIWVDTGYNTHSTYRYAEQLRKQLNLNLFIYHPTRSAAHRKALNEFSEPGDPEYREFIEEVKLEPFRRALEQHTPKYWITGIRREETEYRSTLNIVSPGPGDTTKIAPLINWTESDLQNYITTHQLPVSDHYFDPTKASARQECGLHCRI